MIAHLNKNDTEEDDVENYSGISKEIQCRFILTEEKLRKISSIIREYHVNKKMIFTMSYLILKKNDIFHRTEIVDDILKETNTKNEEILGLILTSNIQLKRKNESTVKIKFVKATNSISLEVSSDDRDWAMLMIADLENIINSICEKRGFYGFMSRSISDLLLYISIIVLPVVVFFNYWLKDLDARKIDLKNEILPMTLDDKLIRIYYNDTINIILYGMVGFMITVIVGNIILDKRLVSTFFKKLNRSFFVWGDEKSRYEKYISTENSIKWVVLIGGAVSIIVSVLTSLLF